MAGQEDEQAMGWMDRLARRWGVAPSRVLVILLVFACTGLSVMFLKHKPSPITPPPNVISLSHAES